MAIVITEAEILDALVKATGPTEAQTVGDMVQSTGFSKWRVRDALKALAAEGRLVLHQIPRATLDGRTVRVPAYTIAPKAKKK